ncbi:MAG TPA: matrixin family metalloprotease [Candidatus Limnocylindria bacterium]
MTYRYSHLLIRLLIPALLASLLLLVFQSAIANAYVLEGQGWCNGHASLSLQTADGAEPYNLDHSTPLNAASTWSGVTTKFYYSNYSDNVSADVWGFATNAGSTWLANTNYTYYPLINCMIAANITWNTYYGWNPGTTYCDSNSPHVSWYDLRSTSLHELGHALGLGHSGDSSAEMYATLAGCTYKGSLATDDRNGIIAIYGQ